MPDSTMATALAPWSTASDRKKWSIVPRNPSIRDLLKTDQALIEGERAIRE